MLQIIAFMNNATICTLLLFVLTGIDLARLLVFREMKLTVIGFDQEYLGALQQVWLLPIFLAFFSVCRSMVASKITKEEVTVVQDFGLQLTSFNILGSVVT
mmetsp:Transcript_30036/g.37161  ORF Transcript_30036/g.37161 Transcript_30036/m.37161 type:complete len:101 (+) Transcript_30036:178-480(+)